MVSGILLVGLLMSSNRIVILLWVSSTVLDCRFG